MRIIACVAFAFFLSACTDPEGAKQTLLRNGYIDIRMQGYSWFGCAESDNYATEFTAKSPAGYQVHGVVCSSIFGKGSTIRFFD